MNIDPPYNTGGDFVYMDDFKDNIKNYKEITGQVDGEGKNLSTNAETSGRYHTDWLNMMYPRLRLARNLLTDDGVIFISIDDNEVDNLKKILSEIFGETNFIADVIWKHTQQSKNDERHFSRQYNHTLVYGKVKLSIPDFYFSRTEEDNKNYANPDNDKKGLWRSGDVRSPNYRKTLCYPIIAPNGGIVEPPPNGWRWSEENLKEKISTGEIFFKPDFTGIIRKIYLCDQLGRTPENLWAGERFGTTRQATACIKNLFDGVQVFDTPKPVELILRMLEISSDEESTVLDFFSGSSTTAHAVMKLNAEDGGNRNFIMVQLPEPCDEKSEAYKAGYKNIAEIGKERIRRAGKKINEEHGDAAENLDIGFKVLKLDNSNIRRWNPDPEDLQTSLEEHLENFVAGRNELDVVYEIMLKYGLDLIYPVEEYEVAGQKVYAIGFGMLMICLGNQITTKVAEGILTLVKKLEPESARVVCRDNGFASDSEKTNVKEILKLGGIEEFISI